MSARSLKEEKDEGETRVEDVGTVRNVDEDGGKAGPISATALVAYQSESSLRSLATHQRDTRSGNRRQ